MFNAQLNDLKYGLKNTDITFKLLLTNTQASKIRKTFANSYSANIKLPKNQLHKIDNQDNS